MILWQNLNFWTAVGEIGIGILVGVAVGILVKRMNRFARPPAYPGHTRICPACGTASLRRARGTPAQRAMTLFTRKWPYACARCNWPNLRAERPSRKTLFTFERSRSSSAVQPVILETPATADPIAMADLAADLRLRAEVEPKPVSKPKPVTQAKPAARPKPVLDVKPVVETKPAPVTRPAPESKPAADVKPAAAATIEPEPAPVRTAPKDDATQVRESVYQFVALVNAGDVTARANCYLSEFTSFGIEGGALHSNKFEGRSSGPTSTFDLRCRDLRVYIHKDTAIATAYLIGTITNANGAPVRVTGRSSWVHLRQNGEWKIAHSHLSPLNPDA